MYRILYGYFERYVLARSILVVGQVYYYISYQFNLGVDADLNVVDIGKRRG